MNSTTRRNDNKKGKTLNITFDCFILMALFYYILDSCSREFIYMWDIITILKSHIYRRNVIIWTQISVMVIYTVLARKFAVSLSFLWLFLTQFPKNAYGLRKKRSNNKLAWMINTHQSVHNKSSSLSVFESREKGKTFVQIWNISPKAFGTLFLEHHTKSRKILVSWLLLLLFLLSNICLIM